MIIFGICILLFLIWGSFLNVVAYRLIRNESIIKPRSRCIHCHHALAWYDLVPLFSYLFLYGKCRYCKKSISPLYPFIETITAAALTTLFFIVDTQYFPAYFLFFSALIVTIRSDLETLLISRFMTLLLIPLGLILSFLDLLPITLLGSLMGIFLGYFSLWISAKLFLLISGKEGMGQGDLELLAFIGSFVGPFGVWVTLLLSTLVGACCGLVYIKIARRSASVKIPFGPFLALGAISYVLFEPFFIRLLIDQSSLL